MHRAAEQWSAKSCCNLRESVLSQILYQHRVIVRRRRKLWNCWLRNTILVLQKGLGWLKEVLFTRGDCFLPFLFLLLFCWNREHNKQNKTKNLSQPLPFHNIQSPLAQHCALMLVFPFQPSSPLLRLVSCRMSKFNSLLFIRVSYGKTKFAWLWISFVSVLHHFLASKRVHSFTGSTSCRINSTRTSQTLSRSLSPPKGRRYFTTDLTVMSLRALTLRWYLFQQPHNNPKQVLFLQCM